MKRKKILITRAAIAPYDVHLFNRLLRENLFDITVLYFEKIESYRKWIWAERFINYKYIFVPTKQFRIFNKILNVSNYKNLNLNEYDEIIVETDLKNIYNNIKLLTLAIKNDIPVGVNITIYKNYKVFQKENVVYKILNCTINKILDKYFFRNENIKKYIGYGYEHCLLVKNNKPTFCPGAYYPLQEEYGKVDISDIKSFNKLRFKDKKKFLIVSYLNPIKKIDFILRIFKKYFNNFNNWELHIVGDGEENYVKYLKSIAGKNVFFHGFKTASEKTNFLKNSDFVIFHSSRDVWGFVTHEALYFGLPIIANINVASAREIVNRCSCGYIYKNETEFVKIIKNILSLKKEKYFDLSIKSKIFIDKFNEQCYENYKKFLEL